MEAVGIATGIVLNAANKSETIVNRFFERKDLAADNVRTLDELNEQHGLAFDLFSVLEDTDINSDIPLRNEFIWKTLDLHKNKLKRNAAEVKRRSHETRKAAFLRTRVKRARNIFERCENDVTRFFDFVRDTVIPCLNESSAKDVNNADKYVPLSNVPPNPPRLTLNYNCDVTFEGKLKSAIIEGSSSGVVGVVASGLGGVGKTCALRGLAKDLDIKDRFSGGLLYMQLGNDAGIPEIIKGIANVVQWTGGERIARAIRRVKDLHDASDKAARWFKGHKCLFLVDDIWKVNGITPDVFTVLGTILQDKSLLIFSTRDERLLERADKIVEFKVRDRELSWRMLMKHADFHSDAMMSSNVMHALEGILDICSGLPLAIGIAGSTVWRNKRNHVSDEQNAWTDYYESLKSKKVNMMDRTAQQYGPLRLIVDNSLEVLQSERILEKSYEEMFRSLCVFQKKQKIHGEVLQKLWELNNMNEVRKVVEMMHGVSLVSMKLEGRGAFYIQIHDLVLDVLNRQALEKNEVEACFSTLANNYMSKGKEESTMAAVNEMGKETTSASTGITDMSRKGIPVIVKWGSKRVQRSDETVDPQRKIANSDRKEDLLFRSWWNVKDDGYILDNICRILQGAGEAEEVLWLLERPQWIVMRLQRSGIRSLENDLRIGENVAKRGNEQREMLKFLEMVRSAARMSWNAVAENEYEAWFQMFGRISWYAKHSSKVGTFVKEIEEHAPRPWVKSSVGLLSEAEGASFESFKITSNAGILRMAHGVEVVKLLSLQGFWGHGFEIFVTEYDRKYGSQKTHALRERYKHTVASPHANIDYQFLKQESSVLCAEFSSDMKFVITGHADGRILVWDSDTGYQLDRRLTTCDSGAVRCIGISGDGTKIVYGSSGGALYVFSSQSDEAAGIVFQVKTSRDEEQPRSIAVSFDGNRFVSSMDDGGFRMWDGRSGEAMVVPSEVKHEYVTCVAMSGDGKRVACGLFDRGVRVWDVDSTEESVRIMQGRTGYIRCVSLSSDGGVVACGLEDGAVCVWDADNGEVIGERLAKTRFVECLAVSMNNNEIVLATGSSYESGRTIGIWDMDSSVERNMRRSVNRAGVHYYAYCGNDTQVLALSSNGNVYALNVVSGDLVAKRVHLGGVSCAAISVDGNRLAFITGDIVHIWDTKICEPVAEFNKRGYPGTVAVSNDGTRAVVCGRMRLEVHETSSGEVMAHLEDNEVTAVAINGDGTRVAFTLETDCDIRIWDVCMGEIVPPLLHGHTHVVRHLTWSADAERVVSASLDNTVRVWNARSGAAVGEVLVHGCAVHHVQTDTHGLRVVSYDGDGNGKLWDVASGNCEMTCSSAAWAATVRSLDLARFCLSRFDAKRNVTVREGDSQGDRVVATTDTRVLHIGDKYFAWVHGPTAVPFGTVVR